MNILHFLKPKEEVAYIYENQTIRQGLEKMKAHGYTAIPVIGRDGVYIGTVSEGDFLWDILSRERLDMKYQERFLVRDILKKDRNLPVNISESMDNLFLRMINQNFVPVVDDRSMFVGIITRKDILQYFYEKNKKF